MVTMNDVRWDKGQEVSDTAPVWNSRRSFGAPRKSSLDSLTITPLPCNVVGIESALFFADGVLPFVALCGPSGWGKSQILSAAAQRITHQTGRSTPTHSATTYLLRGGRWDSPEPLLLDDAQACSVHTRERQLLRNVLELRVRLRRPTLVSFTSVQSASRLHAVLPCPARWVIHTIPEPAREERQVILRDLARRNGLDLSDRLIHVLSVVLDGSGRACAAAIQRLALVGTKWHGLSGELQALATVRPYLKHSWTLCGFTERAMTELFDSLGLEFDPVFARSLTVHLLRDVAAVTEEQVACRLGLDRGVVFAHQSAFNEALVDARVQRLKLVALAALDAAMDRL